MTGLNINRFLIAVVTVMLFLPAQAEVKSVTNGVSYYIDLTQNEHHLGQVEIEFPGTNEPYLEIQMPVWRTGLYNTLNLPKAVRHFEAKSASGAALEASKIDKSTWRIRLQDDQPTQVSYQVYANELGRRSRHIDDTHAYLDASAVFMYADQWRQQPIQVELKVPGDWRSVSGMNSTAAHTFVADNWDILVDSPIETGIHDAYSFTEQGRDYEVVFWGEGNYDAEQTVADLRKLVRTGDHIWSSYPFERYVFMIHATDGAGGATEHLNSTVIQRPRYSYASRKDYLSFMSTASHEFVHTWNVKAYRPDGLVPYEYQHENYTDLLWIAEGSTSYFQDHLLLKAEVMKLDEYLANLAQRLDAHEQKPGTDTMSVAEASFNHWIAEGGPRAHNASVNIYSEGAVISMALDFALLQATDNKVSFRDVHNALYEKFDATETGFTSADVKTILAELTGQDWDNWWQEHVEQPHQVDATALLKQVGLAIEPRDKQEAWVGWRTKTSESGVQLTRVDRHSPAWDAGFTEGDFVVAIDGQRVTAERLQEQLNEHQHKETVTVSYFRRDKLATKTLELAARPVDKMVIKPMAEPTRAQRAQFKAWLGFDHPHAN